MLKFNSTLTSLVWSTFLGGNNNDAAYALALDNLNNVYATGGTSSTNFPTTGGVIHTTYQGGMTDGFITHISANGASALQSTFIGTPQYDQSYFVQLDKNYDVYIFGQTVSAKKISFVLIVSIFSLSCITGLMASRSHAIASIDEHAIIMASSVYVKSSPDLKGNDLFILHEGTKIDVLDELNAWKKIRIANGSIGWIRSEDIEII